jgi:hypothetical protein
MQEEVRRVQPELNTARNEDRMRIDKDHDE